MNALTPSINTRKNGVQIGFEECISIIVNILLWIEEELPNRRGELIYKKDTERDLQLIEKNRQVKLVNKFISDIFIMKGHSKVKIAGLAEIPISKFRNKLKTRSFNWVECFMICMFLLVETDKQDLTTEERRLFKIFQKSIEETKNLSDEDIEKEYLLIFPNSNLHHYGKTNRRTKRRNH